MFNLFTPLLLYKYKSFHKTSGKIPFQIYRIDLTYSRVRREAIELAAAAEASSMLLLNTSLLPGGEEAARSAERVLLTACTKQNEKKSIYYEIDQRLRGYESRFLAT